MRIAQLAPPLERVALPARGGTERVMHTLTEELVGRGHEMTLVASGDSETAARLVPTVDQAVWHHKLPYRDFVPSWSVVLGKARELDDFDFARAARLCGIE